MNTYMGAAVFKIGGTLVETSIDDTELANERDAMTKVILHKKA